MIGAARGECAACITLTARRGSGIFIFILLAAAAPHLLGWFMLAAAGIPAGDALIVARNNGPRTAVYGVMGPPLR
ncbi:hypothetical protein Vqi01_51730 [Micromonospora qiuiae]|uniref:Uncharacterized protein n=1 Tax=Micromonospora qiuiae TaxID=502268 RepID=A0ABQ4JKE3_9ACTN|nr:DUF4267 domain-containing protein [Micromonospora qiuiae]GIJ30011.1 hypothetical protein Vqi01_51730 [Micromonospora qiuiae]